VRTLVLIASVALAGLGGCATNPQEGHARITNIETKGNLQSLKTVGCVSVSELTNQHTPADMFPGVRKCIDAGEFDRGGQLFFVARVYGRYDTLRVADRTAHQAISVLRINNLGDIDEERQSAFRGSLKGRYGPGSPELAGLCTELRRLGAPAYHPTYMLQHGMSAFTGAGGGLIKNFNAPEAWSSALDSYMHCS
jgi:hypothetical protein